MNQTVPDKLYFKIGEVSKLAEVATHVLRYWETEFSGIRPKRASKQRLYRREDVELILTIKRLLHEQGYTISGARKVIEEGGAGSIVETGRISGNMPGRLGSIKEELVQLKQLLARKT